MRLSDGSSDGCSSDLASLRDVGSKAINLLASGVLLSHPHDTQCGLKAFRADVAKAIFSLSRVDRFAFDIEILHLVERHELTLADVPVRLASSDRSPVKVVRDGLRLVRDIWRIRHWSATGAYELDEGGPTRDGIPGLTYGRRPWPTSKMERAHV